MSQPHLVSFNIHIEGALCYLNFGKLVDHFFVWLLVFRVFLFVSLERNMKLTAFDSKLVAS
jgi:hypothetical protein